MKVLITGASGFIGTHLTRKLVRQHYQVTALVRSASARKNLPPRVEALEGDLSLFRDPNLVLPPFDLVIHLAGAVFAPDAHTYHDVNCEATKDLVRCLVRQDWKPERFLYASSVAAAGPSGDEHILSEDDACHPVEPYGHAKLMTEEFLSTVTAFPVTAFRPALVLGPGDRHTLPLFFLARFRLGITVGGKPQMLSFVDVDDLNEAIVTMMEDRSPGFKTYFVSHHDIITNEELFLTLGEVMNHRVFIVPVPEAGLKLAGKLSAWISAKLEREHLLDEKQFQQLTHHFMCSSDKLERELGWEARRNLKATLTKAYNGYRTLGML